MLDKTILFKATWIGAASPNEKVDPNKTETDIIRIVNNRRKDKPKGTRIPTKAWLELCDKLSVKYVYHPLRIKEEKDLEDSAEE